MLGADFGAAHGASPQIHVLVDGIGSMDDGFRQVTHNIIFPYQFEGTTSASATTMFLAVATSSIDLDLEKKDMKLSR